MGNSANKSSNLNVDGTKQNKQVPRGNRKKEKKRSRCFGKSKKPQSQVRTTTGGNTIIPSNSYDLLPPEKPVDPDEIVLSRLRTSLRKDLETFLLNNIIMSVQFFENFEREMNDLRQSPSSDLEMEKNELLSKYQKHCVYPDSLLETVSRRVRFRPQHGSKKHCTELIHSPRLLIVQENAELFDGTDSVDYSTVSVGPHYRLTMEPANMQGFVKLRYDDTRRPTYETILEKRRSEEADYSRIAGDTPTPRDSDEKPDQSGEEEDAFEEMPGLSEGQKMMLDLQEHLQEKEKLNAIGFSTEIGFTYGSTKQEVPKRNFGPQNPFSDPSTRIETRTERRLSGVIRTNKTMSTFTPPVQPQKNKYQRPNKISPAKSMPELTERQYPTVTAKGRGSPQSDSSGYQSGNTSSRTNLSLPNSRGSDVDYGYATIKSYSTPKPLEQLRLGNIPANSSAIPDACFRSVDVALIDKEDGMRRSENGTFLLADRLFETRHYLKSSAFIGNFADIFAEGLAQRLGITSDTLDAATMQGAQILYDTLEQGPNSIPLKAHHRVIPTIASSSWPSAAFEWTIRQRKCVIDDAKHIVYTWPTQRMVRKIKSFGCHVLPEGFMPTRGENIDKDLEWRLAFPEAERFLESCLSHAQVRCFLFTLALFKNFMEPINAELGLSAGHIRTSLLWQCEKNYVAWPEDRPGETLRKFLGVIYEALMKETLPDYFVKGQNQLEGIPRTHIRIVQEKLCRVRENLIMHVLMTARDLRYVDENQFYPTLDYKRLYTIVTTENIVGLMNPSLVRSISQQKVDSDSDDEDSDDECLTDMWSEVRKNDPGRQWNKKVQRQIVAEKAAQKLTNEFTKKSIDSIDLLTIPGQHAESLRRQMLLEHLIPHFMEMAKRSNEFRAPKQSYMYITHAERLTKLLGEETNNNGSARKLMFQIKNLRDAGQVGIDELRSPLEVQTYSRRHSNRPPDSPSTKMTMELPPIPKSPKQKVTVEIHKPILKSPVNDVADKIKPKEIGFGAFPKPILKSPAELKEASDVMKPKQEVAVVHKPTPTPPTKYNETYKHIGFYLSDENTSKNAVALQAISPKQTAIAMRSGATINSKPTIPFVAAVEEESTDF